MTDAQRAALEELARVLFPLAGPGWFGSRPERPFQPSVPVDWRPAPGTMTLSIDDIKVVEFIETLLANEAGDFALAQRWRGLDAKALLAFQDSLPDRSHWRASRETDDGAHALDADQAIFGAVASSNFVLSENGQPLTRG